MDKVIFNLKRFWLIPADYHTGETSRIVDLYEEIKAGRKTSEWRDVIDHWCRRLLKNFERTALTIPTESIEHAESTDTSINLTKYLKAKRAWFMVGYPERSLPRLEADITALLYWSKMTPIDSQFEIKIANIQEILA